MRETASRIEQQPTVEAVDQMLATLHKRLQDAAIQHQRTELHRASERSAAANKSAAQGARIRWIYI